jgi:hypothetical protein
MLFQAKQNLPVIHREVFVFLKILFGMRLSLWYVHFWLVTSHMSFWSRPCFYFIVLLLFACPKSNQKGHLRQSFPPQGQRQPRWRKRPTHLHGHTRLKWTRRPPPTPSRGEGLPTPLSTGEGPGVRPQGKERSTSL